LLPSSSFAACSSASFASFSSSKRFSSASFAKRSSSSFCFFSSSFLSNSSFAFCSCSFCFLSASSFAFLSRSSFALLAASSFSFRACSSLSFSACACAFARAILSLTLRRTGVSDSSVFSEDTGGVSFFSSCSFFVIAAGVRRFKTERKSPCIGPTAANKLRPAPVGRSLTGVLSYEFLVSGTLMAAVDDFGAGCGSPEPG